ncbi:GPI transamidase subunit PIG-U [Cantharellus anzutake]|uniref:GPI transamidase subunit PIG-U n=1 Tax=Cantharellus anzutake TaxID=1750568 RepID=UPI001903EE4D|nr:GPI transamidase subunit PIG-U [Cantharellus anzutake]KAF8342333.1 GPI transamidase subunit PIG-U [Cantharellus anzutake]
MLASFGLVVFVLRSSLFLTNLPQWLEHDAQLTSPFTDFVHLREGVYLFEKGYDPYSGGIVRHPPLYLAIFSTLLPLSTRFASALWAILDGVGAWLLLKIWRMRSRTKDTFQECLIVSAYLLHPYILLPTLALSTSTVDNTLFLASLFFASRGNKSTSLLALAFLTYSSLTSILLAPPISLLILRNPTSALADPSMSRLPRVTSMMKLLAEFLLYLAILHSTIRPHPNPGLWWYFFTEIFDHFRPFFLACFSMHLMVYPVPVVVKLGHDPLFATFILEGIIATFKSYPTLSDPGLFTAMYTLFPELLPQLRHPLPTVMLHMHSALLLPLFHHLWMGQGSGNANFFYASTLVFGLANAAAVIDALRAGLRLGYGSREGYELVQL